MISITHEDVHLCSCMSRASHHPAHPSLPTEDFHKLIGLHSRFLMKGKCLTQNFLDILGFSTANCITIDPFKFGAHDMCFRSYSCRNLFKGVAENRCPFHPPTTSEKITTFADVANSTTRAIRICGVAWKGAPTESIQPSHILGNLLFIATSTFKS